MEFNDNKPIYRQIIDFAYSQIMTDVWQAEQRIPSVRELSVQLQVNSRTVLKAMEHLQNLGIVIVKRGMGFSLSAGAKDMVTEERKKEFFATTLPDFISEMQLLGIRGDDISEFLPK
ncbi:MAG: GntR family transcriptional regulator [Muribaculum sp.]|nr:GntR family transcriptional regulator [Muribaculum sp.]